MLCCGRVQCRDGEILGREVKLALRSATIGRACVDLSGLPLWDAKSANLRWLAGLQDVSGD